MTADIFFSKVAWALKKISLSKLTIKIVVDKETNYIISYSFVCMCLCFCVFGWGSDGHFRLPDELQGRLWIVWPGGREITISHLSVKSTLLSPPFFVIFGQISTEKGQTWFDLVHWKMSMALNSMLFHISLEPATVNFLSLNRQL